MRPDQAVVVPDESAVEELVLVREGRCGRDFVAVAPETSHWSYEAVPALIWLKAMLTPVLLGEIEGKNWLPTVLSTRAADVRMTADQVGTHAGLVSGYGVDRRCFRGLRL